DDNQKVVLAVKNVEKVDDKGHVFDITYNEGDQKPLQVTLATATTPEDVKLRAQLLPDSSVEQIFLSTEPAEGGKSRYFTIRTSEKEADLVQVSIDRLMSQDGASLLRNIKLEEYKVDKANPREATLVFSDPASPGQVKMLLERVLKREGVDEQQPV